MKTVKIPESFGSGDVTITINGAITKIPIGIETEVTNAVAKIVEKMMRDRMLEGLTEEEIKAKELKKLGAADAETVKALEEKMDDLADNPCIKTLWTGCHTVKDNPLEIWIPKELFYNNGKSLIILVHVWEGNRVEYRNDTPIMWCFSFGEEETDANYCGYLPSSNVEGEVWANGVNTNRVNAEDGRIQGTLYLCKTNDDRRKLTYGMQSSYMMTTTAISVLRGDM